MNFSGNPVFFRGSLLTSKSEELVEVEAKVWQSGTGSLPEDQHQAAQEKILRHLSAVGDGRSIEKTNQMLSDEPPGRIRVFAGTPSICWEPRGTIIRRV